MTTNNTRLALGVVLSSLSLWASAASLGSITMRSNSDEPLLAEIRVITDSAEASSLTAGLASRQAHQEAGVPYPVDADALQITLEPMGVGTMAIIVRSKRPLPITKFQALFEIKWDKGYASRPYLVDSTVNDRPVIAAVESLRSAPGNNPASGVNGAAAAPSVAPAASSSVAPTISPSVARSAAQSPAAARPPSVATVAAPDAVSENTRPAPAARSNSRRGAVTRDDPGAPKAQKADPAMSTAGVNTVTVARGETLTSIASRAKDDDVSLDRAMLAIFRANPNAFFGSVHQLRANAVLEIPGRDAMMSQTDRLIASEMRRHTEVFRSYKARLAASPAVSPTGEAAANARAGTNVANNQPFDRLVLSKSDSNSARAEQRTAIESALREANSRVAELERNLSDLGKLAELKDRQIAQATATLQRLSKAAIEQGTTAPVMVAAKPQIEAAPVAASGPAMSASGAVNPASQGSTPNAAPNAVTAAASSTLPSATVVRTAGDGPSVSKGTAPNDSDAVAASAAAAAKAAAAEISKLPPAASVSNRIEAAAEPSFFDSIPLTWIYAGLAILAALGLWLGKRWKERRAPRDRFDKMVEQHSMFNTQDSGTFETFTRADTTLGSRANGKASQTIRTPMKG